MLAKEVGWPCSSLLGVNKLSTWRVSALAVSKDLKVFCNFRGLKRRVSFFSIYEVQKQ